MDSFEPVEARRVLRRLEFHYTPKHASWLNMVEIEIGVMVAQCLDRRIPDKKMLTSEIAAWQRRRNAKKARIHWLFESRPLVRSSAASTQLPAIAGPRAPPHDPVTSSVQAYQCTAVEMRFSIRRCDLMIASAGFVHANGVGDLFQARM